MSVTHPDASWPLDRVLVFNLGACNHAFLNLKNCNTEFAVLNFFFYSIKYQQGCGLILQYSDVPFRLNEKLYQDR